MARKYADLWARVANREEVSILCHPSAAATIKKGMQKEKSLHAVARTATAIPNYGRMRVRVIPTEDKNKVRVTFKLQYSGDNL